MADLGIVQNAALLTDGNGDIVFAGSSPLPDLPGDVRTIDAGGRCVTPGLIDSHAHLVFAGNRAGEFYRRCAGESYADIARAGGGIMSTVEATRAATEDELVESALLRLRRMAQNGTTTVEIKSGYGLTPGDEAKMLRATNRLYEAAGVNTFATYMGAHAIPPEYANGRADYIAQVALSIVNFADEGLMDFVDIFVDPLAFTQAEADKLTPVVRKAGLGLKIHGDEFANNGTAAWAVQRGAVSVDHLGGISREGISSLAASNTVATLLPGTMLFSGHGKFAPARRMIDAGCAVALATDLNPGSSHVYSLPMVMTLACLHMGMTAAECLTACTINAAHALRAADRIGSLEPGKRADLVIWDCDSYEQIPYYVGTNLARTVICGGRVLT